MADLTAVLKLSRIRAGAGAEVLANLTIDELDALVGGAVEDRDLSTPGSPSDGQCFIVKPTGTGAWAGHNNDVAHYVDGQWRFYDPAVGLSLWVKDEKVTIRWDGTSWKTLVGDAAIAVRRITSNESIANAASWTALQWNAEEMKNSGVFTHDNSTNPDQITCKESGTYLVWANITVIAATTPGASRVDARLTINGSGVATSLSCITVDQASYAQNTIPLVAVVTLAANDILRVEAQRANGSGAISSVHSYTRLVVRKLGG